MNSKDVVILKGIVARCYQKVVVQRLQRLEHK